MLYRIFTEDVNRKKVCDICTRFFNSYTMFTAVGVWNGIAENSLCIEVSSLEQDGHLALRVTSAVAEIREVNKQEAVLVQKINVTTDLIYA